MNIKYGNGTTLYGPGVSIHLSADEVATAILAYLMAHNINIQGPRTILVNNEPCDVGHVYVDPAGTVVDADGKTWSGRGPNNGSA